MVLDIFQARLPVHALTTAYIRAITLRCAKVSQRDSFVLFADFRLCITNKIPYFDCD